MQKKAYHVLGYAEIISRLINATAPIDGPSCYPVRIKYDADNMTEPPVITCEVFNVTPEGKWNPIFSEGIDKNTTYEGLEKLLESLDKVVGRCFTASEQNVPYEELLKTPPETPDDLPF